MLDKYIVRTPELVVMLFGKGDSIMVHDEPSNWESNNYLFYLSLFLTDILKLKPF